MPLHYTYLYHYYEEEIGPFHNLSELDIYEASKILKRLRRENRTFAAKREENYLIIRKEVESKIRSLFIEKNDLVLGECPWLMSSFVNGKLIKIPIDLFSTESISFTYGDSFPAMRFKDNRPYRGKIYTINELEKIINTYGIPQIWNRDGLPDQRDTLKHKCGKIR